MSLVHDLREVVEHSGAEQVFGSPISQDGITVLPAAKVSGGGGGGAGPGGPEDAEASGGGLGFTAKPLGVFVLKNGRVSWRPAIDVNRVILGAQIVAVIALLVVRGLIKARRKEVVS